MSRDISELEAELLAEALSGSGVSLFKGQRGEAASTAEWSVRVAKQ